MRKLVFFIGATLLQIGCTTVPQSRAIQAVVERGDYEGVNKDDRFYVTVPASHPGPFSSVDMLNFKTGDKKFRDGEMSAILGKSRKTGEWEVLMLMGNKNGSWVTLPRKTDNTH